MIGPSRGAIFLDKHGTLIEDEPYNADPAQLRFMPNTLPGLRRLAEAGWPLIVVANQPGLATGRIPRAAFAQTRQHISRYSGIVVRCGRTMHLKLPPPE